MEIGLLGVALGIGFSSGLHCLGMCGPIALSLGISKNSGLSSHVENLSYQLGRISTYAALGAVVGLVGTGFSLAGFQSILTIISGVLLLVMGIFSVKGTDWAAKIPFLEKLLFQVRKTLGKQLQKKGVLARYLTGILNGLLPCGMVYIALTASLAAGGISSSVLFMVFFGLGTLPFMFAAVALGNVLSVSLRQKLLKAIPVILILLGGLFILRGLELGIPYVSPAKAVMQTHEKPGQGAECHE